MLSILLMSGITLVVISALMHAIWNYQLKKSSNKYLYNYQMHLLNLLLFTAIFPIIFKKYLYFDIQSVLFGIASGLFFTGYHLFLSGSYKYEDVSLVYPITTSSPIIVSIFAITFLNEKLSFAGGLGIVVIVAGVIFLNSSKLGGVRLTKGVIFAFTSACFYSAGAIVEKIGVGRGNLALYIYSVTFCMTVMMFIYSARYHSGHIKHFKENFSSLLPSSIILFLSVVTYRYGLESVNVSYASAVRQVNAVFGVFLGVFLLKEGFGLKRIIAAVVILLGVFLVKIGI